VRADPECSPVNEVKAETTVLAPLTCVDEAQGSARQCGSGIAYTTQVSRSGMLKFLSKTPGERATELLPACEVVIERSSDDETYGEIAWSREPYEGPELKRSSAAEVLQTTTFGHTVSRFGPVLSGRELRDLDKLTLAVGVGAGQLQDV